MGFPRGTASRACHRKVSVPKGRGPLSRGRCMIKNNIFGVGPLLGCANKVYKTDGHVLFFVFLLGSGYHWKARGAHGYEHSGYVGGEATQQY